jgi:hypothetical protein
LLRRKLVVEISEFYFDGFYEFTSLGVWHPADFFKDFGPAHGGNLLL